MFFHVKSVNNGCLPTRGTPLSAGFDLYSNESVIIDPLQRRRIRLGFAAAFQPGYVGLLLDRSSMGNRGVTRFAGVIDSDYRDEWQVILFNSTGDFFKIERGDRIVQVVFVPFGSCEVLTVDSLDTTERVGGFGSTGK